MYMYCLTLESSYHIHLMKKERFSAPAFLELFRTYILRMDKGVKDILCPVVELFSMNNIYIFLEPGISNVGQGDFKDFDPPTVQ